MDFTQYQQFIRGESERLTKHFPFPDKEKGIFARMVKLFEESGELSEAVLSYFSLQRKSKKPGGKQEVANEIADVIICVSLLAHELNINLEECLRHKMKKINQRKY